MRCVGRAPTLHYPYRRPRRCPRRVQPGRILLRVLQKQNNLVIDLLQHGTSCRILLHRSLHFSYSRQGCGPYFWRRFRIGCQNHQALRNLGLHHAREVPLRCRFRSVRKSCSSPGPRLRSPVKAPAPPGARSPPAAAFVLDQASPPPRFRTRREPHPEG